MVGIILPGKATEADCQHCGGFVPATYDYGEIQLSSGLRVDKVMRATCDCCGEVLEIAHQSAHRIREAKQVPSVKVNFRLSQPLKDYAESRVAGLGGQLRGAVELLVRAGLMAAWRSPSNHRVMVERLRSMDDPVLGIPADVPDTLLLSTDLHDEAQELRAHLPRLTLSEIIRRLLVASADEPMIQRELGGSSLLRSKLRSSPRKKAPAAALATVGAL